MAGVEKIYDPIFDRNRHGTHPFSAQKDNYRVKFYRPDAPVVFQFGVISTVLAILTYQNSLHGLGKWCKQHSNKL
jgi:hypothetical protein